MSILLFADHLYALPILRPLQAAAHERDIDAAWVVTDEMARRLHPDEHRITSLAQARRFAPQSVFSAANWVAPALPGDKIEVFHGFDARKHPKKNNHFRVRGFFDLYCTQGPETTAPFRELAEQHGYFAVAETGWSKMDPLFGPPDPASQQLTEAAAGRPCVMYASTFSTGMSAAPDMLDTLHKLIPRGDRYWLLTLHPKCSNELFSAYQALAETYPQHAMFADSEHLLTLERAADMLVCDTSSVIQEMVVQHKPVVTIRNKEPKPYMLDVGTVDEVDDAINKAMTRPETLMDEIKRCADDIHPYRDGHSSDRMLDAAQRLAEGGYGKLKGKPWNLWRRWQRKKQLKQLLPDS